MQKQIPVKKLAAASELIKLLANPERLKILCLLSEGELNVGDLGRQLKLSQSALSQHLARLRSAGAVKTRKSSQQVYYMLAEPKIRKIIGLLHTLYCK